jgi:hypothetical protein
MALKCIVYRDFKPAANDMVLMIESSDHAIGDVDGNSFLNGTW